jgi:phytoene dehydrogenase-like protein
VLECTIPSVVDPTVAPPGRHLMSMFVQYAPYALRGSTWDEERERFADRCFDVLDEYAPGQLFSFRPVPGYADYRTPVEGLYLCGAAAHAGGGVMGIPGRNAAREILRARRRWRLFGG